VTEDDIRPLLYRRESETLDFKRDQYPFSGRTDDQKSELLKDILAFANAWRSSPAHILIGVQEASPPIVVGIPEADHLQDHSLQQFVNSKTNQPVRFGYQRVVVGGQQVGVLVIDFPQRRPIFLTKAYGNLKAGVVYIRRGSSTAEAMPDEVADMGRDDAQTAGVPTIDLEFASGVVEERLGTLAAIECVRFDVRSPLDQADAEADRLAGVRRHLDRASLLALATDHEDEREWQELAADLMRLGGFREIRLWVRNASSVTANDVNLRLELPYKEGAELIGEYDHPKYDPYNLAPPFGSAAVTRVGDRWRAEIRLQKLQPREEEYTGTLLVRAVEPVELMGSARIAADNLTDPIIVPVGMSLTVTRQSIGYFEARELRKKLLD
jgi:hypothetical protein